MQTILMIDLHTKKNDLELTVYTDFWTVPRFCSL